jgi:hypothetical protein
MRRLSWLAALDPLLLGTAQCLLYLPIGGHPSAPQCTRAKTAIQAKSGQGQQSIPPSSYYFRAATMHQPIYGDVR